MDKNVSYEERKTDSSYYVHLICDGKFSGNVKLVPMPRNVSMDLPSEYRDNLYLTNLRVDPEQRGKGFGTSMLEKAIEFAREKQKHIITVVHSTGEGRMSNEELTVFCQTRGFSKLDIKIQHCLRLDTSSICFCANSLL